MSIDRRTFIKVLGSAALAPAALSAACAARGAPAVVRRGTHVVVIGAGAWGGWTAHWLQQHGARVTLVDMYGPGNSRASSGDETRGLRTGYGANELWTRWADEALRRWTAWDEEWAAPLQRRHIFPTGNLILRASWDSYTTETRATWDRLGIPYELLDSDELSYRYPQIASDGMHVALYEPHAGVARARRCCESVAEIVQRRGGTLRIAHAAPGTRGGGRLHDVVLQPAKDRLHADAFVFACGVWLPKVLPDAMAGKMRGPIGHVFYFGTPPGDTRFTFPHMPSFDAGGTTGWPALGHDHRGFRIRFGGRAPEDPDTSERWIDPALFDGVRDYARRWFPALAGQPIVETRACHYDGSINRNFIIDRHPELDNVWIAGAGQAEGFKMGPVVGEYAARRVLGLETDAALADVFRLPVESYE